MFNQANKLQKVHITGYLLYFLLWGVYIMELDRNIHIEAFIKIPIQYEEYQRTIKTCGQHENHKGDAFCPICGGKIKEVKRPDKSMMWCEELIGNENFYHYTEGETMYLFSNMYDCGVNTEENTFTKLTPQLIKEKIHYFETQHKQDIELLREKINVDIKVEFGFVYTVS